MKSRVVKYQCYCVSLQVVFDQFPCCKSRYVKISRRRCSWRHQGCVFTLVQCLQISRSKYRCTRKGLCITVLRSMFLVTCQHTCVSILHLLRSMVQSSSSILLKWNHLEISWTNGLSHSLRACWSLLNKRWQVCNLSVRYISETFDQIKNIFCYHLDTSVNTS